MQLTNFAFCASTTPLYKSKQSTSPSLCKTVPYANAFKTNEIHKPLSRRQALTTLAAIALGSKIPNINTAYAQDSSPDASSNTDSTSEPTNSVMGFQTKSGLKYVDFADGSGPVPQWGDLLNVQYVVYTISESGDSLVKQDSTYDNGNKGFLIHHGNGEIILGLEEALHTMKPGGRRRVIIPRNLAYYKDGFAPIPGSEGKRIKFSKALRETGGTVVFDVELRSIMKDEDDQGYYTDLIPSKEELLDMFEKSRVKTVPEGAKSITI